MLDLGSVTLLVVPSGMPSHSIYADHTHTSYFILLTSIMVSPHPTASVCGKISHISPLGLLSASEMWEDVISEGHLKLIASPVDGNKLP